MAIPIFTLSQHAGRICITKLDREQLYEENNHTENWQDVLTSHDPDEAFDNFTATCSHSLTSHLALRLKSRTKSSILKSPG